MNEMMILDEVQEDSGTTDTFHEKDFENFLNFCKDDDPQVYIIHDVLVFCPRWIFQVPINTPKFST